MKTKNRQIGDFGESIALKFLMKRGFVLVERNYLRQWGEIDLIMKKGTEYHFIEVKTSVSYETTHTVNHETMRAEDNIHSRKLERMSRVVQTYCIEKSIQDEDVYIDAVIVYLSPDYKRANVILLDSIVL